MHVTSLRTNSLLQQMQLLLAGSLPVALSSRRLRSRAQASATAAAAAATFHIYIHIPRVLSSSFALTLSEVQLKTIHNA
jgi:hypothetical protein